MCLKTAKELLRSLFGDGISSVTPGRLVNSVLKVENENVIINSKHYDLSKGKCFIVGFGKAVLDMALETEKMLKGKIERGIVSVPEGFIVKNVAFSNVDIFRGASGNIPDVNSVKATDEIVNLMKKATVNDLVLVMISGGGSALLAKPKNGISLHEKIELIKSLGRSGADIKELNCVRKRISEVKGGKLARYIYPARSVSLILSDIVGDPLDFIASGPTVKNNDHPSEALKILEKYNLQNETPKSVLLALRDDVEVDEEMFKNVDNIIIGNNTVALETVQRRAVEEGFRTVILSSKIEEQVDKLSSVYADLAKSIVDCLNGQDRDFSRIVPFLNELKVSDVSIGEVEQALKDGTEKLCLLSGGETVCPVKGHGKGGRNQELALRFSTHFDEEYLRSRPDYSVIFLSGGTDGIDGPTDAAGALAYSGQSVKAASQGLDPREYIKNSDSYSYFSMLDCAEDLIKTGHTGVNVMDLHILLIERKRSSSTTLPLSTVA